MIEFIVPLNLPVRAVELTAVTEGPSERLRREMIRWASNQQDSLPNSPRSPNAHSPINSAISPGQSVVQNKLAEIELERESLLAEKKRYVDAVVELAQATKQTKQKLDRLVQDLHEAAVELAQVIAAKLIFEEVDANRFPIANLVHEVLSRLDSSVGAAVRLHPDDLAMIEEQPAIHDSNRENSVKFIADSSLARGDCKAKAGEITVIYELRRQIGDIRQQLLSTVSGHAEA